MRISTLARRKSPTHIREQAFGFLVGFCPTSLVSIPMDSGHLPTNPSIGGAAKLHYAQSPEPATVREAPIVVVDILARRFSRFVLPGRDWRTLFTWSAWDWRCSGSAQRQWASWPWGLYRFSRKGLWTLKDSLLVATRFLLFCLFSRSSLCSPALPMPAIKSGLMSLPCGRTWSRNLPTR